MIVNYLPVFWIGCYYAVVECLTQIFFFDLFVVVIEEIEDDKPTNGKSQSKPLLKNNQSNGSEDNTNSQHQIVKRGAGVPVLESEDEDGFPISTKNKTNVEKPESATEQKDKVTEKTKKKKAKDGDDAVGLKRKVENIDQDHQERWVIDPSH